MREKEPQKAYEKVTSYIKEEILSGRIQQGQRIPPERELAEKLGISRNSVREALRTLEVIGLITSTQGAGNSISCNFEENIAQVMSMMFLMHKTDYRELSELRSGLEMKAVELAATYATPRQIDAMEKLVRQLAVSREEDVNVRLDRELHISIAQASGNQLIFSNLSALSDVMDAFISSLRKRIYTDDGDREKLQAYHEQMIHCLRCRDGKGAREAMACHFQVVDKHLDDVLM